MTESDSMENERAEVVPQKASEVDLGALEREKIDPMEETVTLKTESNSSLEMPDEATLRKRNRRSVSWHLSPSVLPSQFALNSGNTTPLTFEGSIIRSLSHDITSEFAHVASRVAEQTEEFMIQIWKQGWKVVSHHSLPHWLKDNDFLIFGHRPPLNSFKTCFRSIFRIHTETGNIWTHLIGFLAFIMVAVYSLSSLDVHWQEKFVFAAFFAGAIICLGFSWLFHTVYCHSESVGRLFSKLDYCGIALLTMGSFMPWLYYAFYCTLPPKIIYASLILVLGSICIAVSLMDKFAKPSFRPLRAGVFIALGLSGVIPSIHYMIQEGFWEALYDGSLGWLVLMAFLYIAGAVIYAFRFPECVYPGMFDIWFQSHQIFHVFVVVAAFVHLYGIYEISTTRQQLGPCIA